VLLLTDCDPYGLEIALTYKFGSLAMAWAPERLAVPSSLLPSDVARLGIPPDSMRPLSTDDRKKVREDVRDCCPLLLPELECLWGMGRKAGIQQLFEEREPGFLAHSYLPSKLHYVGERAAGGTQTPCNNFTSRI
jgi:meiotic recombination protein SPO11